MSSRERALVALTVALSASWIALRCFRPDGTEDFWWTLRVGDHVLETGAVPRTLTWTNEALAGLPYVCHAWLAALAFAAWKAAFGLDAVPALSTLVALATFAALLALARRLGAPWLLAVALVDLSFVAIVGRMRCRAEVFGYLCFGLALVAVAELLRRRRLGAVAWLVPLALLWANLHGSFLLLFGLLPLVGAGLALDAWRAAGFRPAALLPSALGRESAALFAVWMLAGLATLVNPYGTQLVPSVLAQSTSPLWRATIEEWWPLWAQGSLPAAFLVPAALVLLALASGWRRLSFVSVLLALAFAGLALWSNRQLALFGFGVAFLLADRARELSLGPRARTALAVALVAALVAANATAVRPFGLEARRLSRHPSPWMTTEGLAFVREHLRGNVLNRWHLGGLLIYFAWPQVRVAIDSRADPYPPEYFWRYRRAIFGSAQDTLAFCDDYAIDHIVIDVDLFRSEFRRKLAGLTGFRMVYADPRSVVLSRAFRGAREGAAP